MSDEIPPWALPIDADESLRVRRGRSAKRWIEPLILVWLVAHVSPYLLLFAVASELINSDGSFRWFVLPCFVATQLFAMFAAGAAAIVTLRNWPALSWRWLVGGLLPWTVILGEITVAYAITLL